ncbi:hypothetical protein C2S53_003004 [Perilla frutescens var. hirtella]|uniref:BHLH domain-containing protein n=1 Tax=Perilla frutescens var. hirtella TaxID=608512 RepID=A0AAD4PBL5_PERFH|nr:hypothetical protein C2S53_003004 [Perilla frutescens var. hirtella]
MDDEWPADLVDEMINSSFYEGGCNRSSEQELLGYKRAEPPCYYSSEERPLKQLRTTNWITYDDHDSMSNSHMPTSSSFHFATSTGCDEVVVVMKPKQEPLVTSAKPIAFQSSSSTHQQHRDHSLAERKRREKLSQKFIALSSLVPGLKKMDKASVLEDAIEYMKHLEEKVKGLEEKAKKITAMESVIFIIKKDDDDDDDDDPALPVMEARFCEKELLISIHCERRKGVLEKIVGEIEKLHLSVVNSSVMAYGHSSLSITVIAEKNEEANMSMEQLKKNLRGVLKIIKLLMK